ncbi:MAG: VWA domain-containing protein [Pseudomonadota bacterium]|jgi:uncharacterized protein with von Willebrand factor type A (vWA) domain
MLTGYTIPCDGLELRLVERLAGFARTLRNNGFCGGLAESIDIARVAALGHLTDPRIMRWQLRSLLCSNRLEWRSFDELYDHYWFATRRRTRIRETARATSSTRRPLQIRDWPAAGATQPAQAATNDVRLDSLPLGPGNRDGETVRSLASFFESAGERDFRSFRDARDQRALEQLVDRIARKIRRRLLGRLKRHRGGPLLDFATTIRNALPTGGESVRLAWRRRKPRQPKLVLVMDVSASMNPYSMLMLRFARGLCSALTQMRVFAFHTRLVNLTATLHESSDQRMAARLEAISAGWSGGTRIGPALTELVERHGKDIFRSKPSLIVVSDGLDTTEPEILVNALRRMKPHCRRVYWLNPLLGREGYEPKARGMYCALPYLDAFLPAHNLKSLLALEPLLLRC